MSTPPRHPLRRGGPRLPPWFRPRVSLALLFATLVGYGILLTVERPSPTTAQLVFRVAIVVAGIAGLGWLWGTRR